MNTSEPSLADSLDGLGPRKRGGQHDAALEPYKAHIIRAFKNGASLRAVAAQINKYLKLGLGAHALIGFCERHGIDRPKKIKDADSSAPQDPPPPDAPTTGELPFDDAK